MLEVPAVQNLAGRRVVVTGGAGFIGSALCRVLERSGAAVTAYDNMATGSLHNLTEGPEAVADFAYGDVRDAERLRRVLKGVEVVYHLACLGVRHSLHSPQENHAVNATGTLTLLQEARASGVGRVVHVSSSEVYGTARKVPMTEDHVADPHTVYGGSKLAGECYARAFARCYDYDAVVLRPFNAYGPRSHSEGDSGEVIPRFILQALTGRALSVFGDGLQTRDLTHVYDTARTVAVAGIADGVAGETFNVGSNFEISVNEIAELVRKCSQREVAIEHLAPRPGDVLRLFADSSRAERRLGHRPAIPLEEGVADLVDRFAALGADVLEDMARSMRVRNWE